MPNFAALARQSAVIVPSPSWDTLVVTGPDRRSWLEGLVTCELKQLAPGQGTWGLVLNRQGKIQSVVWVVADSDSLWLALAPGTRDTVEPELARMLIMEDAELTRPSEAHTWFALHGPEAVERAAALAKLASGRSAPIDWTGLGGAALVAPSVRAADVLAGSEGLQLGEEDWTRLRLERGLPEFGADFQSQDRPHEAALERRAVSWTKGCYLGQEVVCMQDMRGKVKRSLRVLAVAAPRDADVKAGAELLDASGQNVGTVTAVAFSEVAGSWLAMARLKLDSSELRYSAGEGAVWAARLSQPV
jgi:folate-binding protein YgfZ